MLWKCMGLSWRGQVLVGRGKEAPRVSNSKLRSEVKREENRQNSMCTYGGLEIGDRRNSCVVYMLHILFKCV